MAEQWTAKQVIYLKQNYGRMTGEQIAAILGKVSRDAVNAKARRLGLSKKIKPANNGFQNPYLSEFLLPEWREKYIRGEVTIGERQ